MEAVFFIALIGYGLFFHDKPLRSFDDPVWSYFLLVVALYPLFDYMLNALLNNLDALLDKIAALFCSAADKIRTARGLLVKKLQQLRG